MDYVWGPPKFLVIFHSVGLTTYYILAVSVVFKRNPKGHQPSSSRVSEFETLGHVSPKVEIQIFSPELAGGLLPQSQRKEHLGGSFEGSLVGNLGRQLPSEVGRDKRCPDGVGPKALPSVGGGKNRPDVAARTQSLPKDSQRF